MQKNILKYYHVTSHVTITPHQLKKHYEGMSREGIGISWERKTRWLKCLLKMGPAILRTIFKCLLANGQW